MVYGNKELNIIQSHVLKLKVFVLRYYN